jgi:stage II sporulation protein E
LSLESCPLFDMVFGVAKAAKDNREESGDNYSLLKFGFNKFMMAICDGMGNGKNAQDISEKATSLIENFYRAEFDSEIILSSVNKLLNLHGGEYFSTIDICSVDLSSGVVDFVKLGATASFIKHSDTITKIDGGALPVGVLEDANPKITKTSLDFGDIVVLTSDGVVDCMGEETLEQFILDCDSAAPQELADKILGKAKSSCGGVPNDDMTVVVGKIFKNN